MQDVKECTKCGKWQPVENFYWRTHRGKYEPFQPCKVCAKAQNNARYASDAEHRQRQITRSQRQAERRRTDPEYRQYLLERERRYRDANRERMREYSRAARERHPRSRADSHRKMRYGLAAAEVVALTAGQNGKCPICKIDLPRKADIDHDHVTGKVRGILCPQCNRGLGMFGDDLERLRSAVVYLESHKPDQDRV